MDVRLRPSLVPAKRSQAQAVDVNGPGGGAPEGLNPSVGNDTTISGRCCCTQARSAIARPAQRE
jgi:hypothetical protein